MYTCKYIAEAHGGKIAARNDSGLRIQIFRLLKGERRVSKILIIEDDPEIALLKRIILKSTALRRKSFDGAGMAALKGGYALILLDLMLPAERL